jgi:UDP-3-O-[3-hydroxymyristoyl] N-acetylglucosamine deacetylase
MPNQQTIAAPFTLSGVGLHTGEIATVTVCPAPVHTGRYFLLNGCTIPARFQAVTSTVMSTELSSNDKTASVQTVEHLLAALFGMGIDNARIEIDHSEMPILDGSALPWVQAIASVGVQVQDQLRPQPKPLAQTISVQKGDSFVVAIPSDHLWFSYGIEFPSAAIGLQWFSCKNMITEFAEEIAPARTFTMTKEIEYLRSQGLIQGGSLDNAIVCDDQKWLNPPLRFSNEPCRHKLLDLIGDLSLLGYLPQAHIIAFKASHSLHTQLARSLMVDN